MEQIIFTFEAGQALSNSKFLGNGCFGALIVPAGLVTSFVEMQTVVEQTPYPELVSAAGLDGVKMLRRQLVAQYCPFSADDISRIGGAGTVKLKLCDVAGTAVPVGTKTQVILWWKS